MDRRLETAVRRLFAPARTPGRIGVEIEMFAPDHLAVVTRPGFVRLARPSREPGGQLELSPAPQASPAALVRLLDRCIRQVELAAAAAGDTVHLLGTHPLRTSVPLKRPTPRYQAMQELFDRVGPDGRRMMRLTASLQVCVDLLPGRDGIEQWLVANLAGPPLTATFANSPHLDGRLTNRPGNRTRIWSGVDLTRTGYDGRHLDAADPIGAYLAFAAAADRLAIPEAADPAYHLGTLFPPVRPRGGYLEIRYLDSQPVDRIGDAIAILHTLLYDAHVRREALELLLPRLGDEARSWGDAAEGRSEQAPELLRLLAAPIRREAVAA